MLKTAVATLALLVGVGTFVAPSPAQAYWWRGRWIGPVVVAPVPAVPVYAAPRPLVWVPPHYNRFGYFVPGHWR